MGTDVKTANEAEREYRNALNWARKEEKELTAKLKREGKWKGGLDANSADFAYINQELKRRIKEIQKKYGILSN